MPALGRTMQHNTFDAWHYLQVHADTLRDDEAGVRVATVLVYLVRSIVQRLLVFQINKYDDFSFRTNQKKEVRQHSRYRRG